MCMHLVDFYEWRLANRYKWTLTRDMQGKKRIKNLFALLINSFRCFRSILTTLN